MSEREDGPSLGLEKTADGQWHWTPPETYAAARDQFPAYLEALPRYFGAFERLFAQAADTCEFEFVMTLLRVRGMADAGWDPFETTLRAIPKVRAIVETQGDYEVRRHLSLWLYGHIFEASEPYELIANMIEIAGGGTFRTDHFPRTRAGTTPGPGAKIQWLRHRAAKAQIEDVAFVVEEGWDRQLRNAAVHSDYSLHGSTIRTGHPYREYSTDEFETLLNRGLAYYDALISLYKAAIRSYDKPKVIPTSLSFSRGKRNQTATVIVRQGYGAAGLSAWVVTPDETVRTLVGRFTLKESHLLDIDQQCVLLPPEATDESEGMPKGSASGENAG